MSKKVEIKSCDDCPHFDNEYYSYTRHCDKLNRIIPWTDDSSIPKDCPLDDWKPGEGEKWPDCDPE